MWVSCGSPIATLRMLVGARTLDKGGDTSTFGEARCKLCLCCILPRGDRSSPGVLRPPCSQQFDGCPFWSLGLITTEAPGQERRFVSTCIPEGRKASSACPLLWLDRDAFSLGHAELLAATANLQFSPADELWCRTAAGKRGLLALPLRHGALSRRDVWLGPGTAPGLNERNGAGGEANKQTFLHACKLSEMSVQAVVVFSVSLSFFCNRLPVEGFVLLFYSCLRFGAADCMWRGDTRTGAERSSQRGTGSRLGGPTPAPLSVSKH